MTIRTCALRLIMVALIFLLLSILFLFLVIPIYNHPTADDFCNFNSAFGRSYLDYLDGIYMQWSGRYSQGSILYFINKCDLLVTVKVFPVFLILLHIHSMYFFIRKLIVGISKFHAFFFLTLPFVLLYYSLMPSISQGLFWLASSSTYLISAIFVTYYTVLVSNYVLNQMPLFKKFVILIIGVILIGLNESILLYTVAFTLFIYINRFKELKLDKFFITLILLQVICSMLSIFAPGNFSRLRSETNLRSYDSEPDLKLDVFHSVNNSLFQFFECLSTNWAILIFVFSVVLLCVYFFIDITIENRSLKRTKRNYYVFVVPLFAMPFPSFYATNYFQSRTENLLLWVMIVVAIIVAVDYVFYRRQRISFTEIKIWLVVLFFSVIYLFKFIIINNSNLKILAYDIFSNRAQDYDRNLRKRYARFKVGEFEVDSISNAPPSLFIGDIKNDTKHWINGCTAEYFKLKKVMLVKE
jgi:hypothetical protein